MIDKNNPYDQSIQPRVDSKWDPRDSKLITILSAPGDFVYGVFSKFQRQNPDNKFYHRRYRRVPGIETCHVDDAACIYEANRQFERDKKVEREILTVLNFKLMECRAYYIRNRFEYCAEIKREKEEAETNYFTKYGDLATKANASECLMKQKHRMIWERRHGEVGSGMTTEEKITNRPLEPPRNRKIFGLQDKYINLDTEAGIRLRDQPLKSD